MKTVRTLSRISIYLHLLALIPSCSGSGSTSDASSVGGSAAGGETTLEPTESAGGTTATAGVGGSATIGGSATTSSGGTSSSGGTTAKGATTATAGAAGCPVQLVGFAAVNADSVNGTTGGGNATPTTVTTYAAFKAAVQDSAPRVVVVSGTIRTTDGDGYGLKVASNKTIMGATKSATIYGGLAVSGVSNVIIRTLNIQGVYPNAGPGDTLASNNSHHIWYDHLAVWNTDDGLLDITNQSNYNTVSWTKFYYTNSANGHRLASLNGSGGGDHPEDSRYLKGTYHHNWWSTSACRA